MDPYRDLACQLALRRSRRARARKTRAARDRDFSRWGIHSRREYAHITALNCRVRHLLHLQLGMPTCYTESSPLLGRTR